MDRDNVIQGHKEILIMHKKNKILLFKTTWKNWSLYLKLQRKTNAIVSHLYVESLKYDSTEIKSRSWFLEVCVWGGTRGRGSRE